MENTLASRLRFVRGKESREKFANRIEVSPRALANYEYGEREPKGNVIAQICARLGIEANWLLSGVGPMHKAASLCSQDEKVRRVGQNTQDISVQHIENIDTEENKHVRRVGQVGNTDILDRYLRAVDENNTLIRENADLRVQAERHLSRIRELEREKRGTSKDAQGGFLLLRSGWAGRRLA